MENFFPFLAMDIIAYYFTLAGLALYMYLTNYLTLVEMLLRCCQISYFANRFSAQNLNRVELAISNKKKYIPPQHM